MRDPGWGPLRPKDIETIISEIGVVNNFLDFNDPYLGKTKNTNKLFDLIDEESMHKKKLGYKFQACLRVN